MSNLTLNESSYASLLGDLRDLLSAGKKEAEAKVNSILALTYWEIGKRIAEEKLSQKANYHNSILQDLEEDLGIKKATLTMTVNFFKTYPKKPKLSNLTWSHYRYLIGVKNEKTRQKLTQQIEEENWGVAKLGNEISRPKTPSGKGKIKRPTRPDYLYKAEIVDVVDGDTLILNIDLGFQVIKEQRARLTQINAAEMGTAEGKAAYRYLRDLCARLDTVVVKTNKIDIYGRYLVDLFYLNEGAERRSQSYFFEKGVYLSEELVREGVVGVW